VVLREVQALAIFQSIVPWDSLPFWILLSYITTMDLNIFPDYPPLAISAIISDSYINHSYLWHDF
jgi:hypothetical protein